MFFFNQHERILPILNWIDELRTDFVYKNTLNKIIYVMW